MQEQNGSSNGNQHTTPTEPLKHAVKTRTGLHSFTSESPEGITIVNWQLYDTVIVRLFKNLVQLNHGTHKTKHTKNCINDILTPLGYKVKQKAKAWIVVLPTGKEVLFRNHMTIEDKRTVIESNEEN